jgi:hypothetical protein
MHVDDEFNPDNACTPELILVPEEEENGAKKVQKKKHW